MTSKAQSTLDVPHRSLVFASAAVGVLGIGFAVLATAAPGALEALYRLAASPGTAVDVGPASRLGAGIYGGLMAGWGVTLVLMARGGSRVKAAGLGLLTWWVIDSASSVALGFPWNALSNTAFLGLFAPVVLATLRRKARTADAAVA